MVATSTSSRTDITNTDCTVSGFDNFDNDFIIYKTSEADNEVKVNKLLKEEAIEEIKSGYHNPLIIGKPLKSKVNNKIKVIRNCLIRKIRSD